MKVVGRTDAALLPKQRFIQTTQIDDGFERAFRNLALVRHRHSRAVATGQLSAKDDMAAGLTHPDETMRSENSADFRRRERAEFRHGSVGAVARWPLP